MQVLLTSLVFRTIRFGLICLLVFIGIQTAIAFHRVFRQPTVATEGRLMEAEQVAISPNPLDYLQGTSEVGYWSFVGWEWKLGHRWVNRSQVEKRFRRPPGSVSSGTHVDPERDSRLFRALDSMPLERKEMNGKIQYNFEDQKIRARVSAKVFQGQRQFIEAVAAIAQDDQRWLLVEVLPHCQRSDKSTAATSLLPLPESAVQICSRWSGEGGPDAELFSIRCMAGDLLEIWTSAGWEIRQNPGPTMLQHSYLCTKGDQLVQAWGTTRKSALEGLLLVRLPNGSHDPRSVERTTNSGPLD